MDYRLSVDRQHLMQGLQRIRSTTRPRKHGRATIGFDGGYITVDVGRAAFVAHATGAWPGNAIVAPAIVYALARVPPPDDPVIVTCDGEHIHFGPIRAGCIWQPVSGELLELPQMPAWFEGIALKYTMPRGRIIAEGRGPEVKVAERRLAAVLRRVAKSLAPAGVTLAEVESLVELRLAERYGTGSPSRSWPQRIDLSGRVNEDDGLGVIGMRRP
jgi:hypothetical protein